MNTKNATVIHEEIIVHPTVKCIDSEGLIGTARIMGNVEIDGIRYKFERVVPIRFVKDEARIKNLDARFPIDEARINEREMWRGNRPGG